MKRLIAQWWPVDKTASPPADLDVPDTKLQYGERAQLVDLQPYILRWALVWAGLTLFYSVTRWLPAGRVRIVFICMIALLWLASGVAFGALLLMQQRRREAAERQRGKSPVPTAPTS